VLDISFQNTYINNITIRKGNFMKLIIKEGFAIFKNDTVVAIEEDVGNAMELHMVLSEADEDSEFTIRRFKDFGAIIL
jgi:hypothetical protein